MGSLASAAMTLGPVSRILLRSCHAMIAYHTENFTKMKKKFMLSNQAGIELQFMHQLLPQLNGQLILLSHT